MKKVWIIEDDANICEMLSQLFKETYTTKILTTGTEAILALNQLDADLILLDLMLPEVMGESILKQIRQRSNVPVIILTAVTDKERTVQLLKEGANDYITKPFSIEELEARMEVQLRNSSQSHEIAEKNSLEYKNVILNKETVEVLVKGTAINLAQKEFQLLELLMTYPKKIYSKRNLYETVWQDDYIGGENTVNVHISNIRKKIKQLDAENEYIETVWGMGIRLAKESDK